jgi:hypothetical protein
MLLSRWRARAAKVGMTVVIGGSIMAASANASTHQRSQQAPVLRPQFRKVASAGWIWAGSRYALLGPVQESSNQSVTVIDDQTGRRATVSRAGCFPIQPSDAEPLDLSRVLFNCSTNGTPAPELYSPSTGGWQTVSPSPAITHPCGDATYPCDIEYFLAAAGSYWLEYIESDCPMAEHCSYGNVFQNIDTGEVRKDPSGGRTTIDLNASNLTRTVCRPLSVPMASQVYAGPGPGSLIFYRSFALAIGTDENAVPGVYLERCGTHLQRLLTKGPYPGALMAPAANTHEVVWLPGPRPFLSVLSLPALQRFTIRLPERILGGACSPPDYTTCISKIALTEHTLYILSSPTGPLWAAHVATPTGHHHK